MALSRTERGLRLITDVHEGEGPTAMLLFSNVFLIMCAYYLIKPLREGWIMVSDIEGLSKMEIKAYSSFGQSILLIPIVMFYARLSTRLNRSELISRATLFLMSNMLVFWIVQPHFILERFFGIEKVPYAGVLFYLWLSMFSVFIVAQFFAFAADIYADDRGDRLLPLIALGATCGAVFGSMLIGPVINVESGLRGGDWLLVIAMLPLGASIFLTRGVDRREPADPSRSDEVESVSESVTKPEEGGRGAFSVVFSSRFLIGVAVITLLLNWVNTNGENLLFGVIEDVLIEDAQQQGITDMDAFKSEQTTLFYGNFFLWVNIVALTLQALVASRILRYGGFGMLLLMLPTVALVSYTAMALVPILAIVKLMKIAENATDYSINNTARHVLWVPVSAEMKYKGKPTIDTFFVRLGDGLAALTILIGVQFLDLPKTAYFAFNVSLVVIWVMGALVVIREHKRLTGEVATHAEA